MSLSLERFCNAGLLLAVCLLASGCSSDESSSALPMNEAVPAREAQAPPRAEGKLVLAFGDSLYAGYGLAQDESFPAVLEQALRRAGTVATVHNAGVSGDTSAAGLQRLGFTLDGLARKPDLAIVGLGANDMLRGLDPAATETNMLAICQELRRRDIKVVLTGMLAAPNLGADYAKRFNGLFPRTAEKCGAALYPFFLEDVITNRGLMLPDGIHPNAAGVSRIVRKIQPLIGNELANR